MEANVQLKEIHDRTAWNQFVLSLNPNTFLHSWEWGQLQKHEGETPRYIGVFKDNVQIGAFLLLTVNARRGRFLFIPHGPLFKTEEQTRTYLPEVIKYCKQVGTQDKAVALRISPLLITNEENTKAFKQLGFRPAPIHMHSELTWVLDISGSEDEILKQMRKTTRHAIRKAIKAGVTVEFSSSPDAVKRFMPLYETTKDRHGFIPFPTSFIKEQAELFRDQNRMFFAFASHEGKDVAAAMIILFGTTAFYYHGASLKQTSKVSPAQLLQFESMKQAKTQGVTQYNFWGIAPDNQPNHPFAGITVFKKGFGGRAIDYMHAQDLPLNLRYWKLWAIDMYRKVKRGF